MDRILILPNWVTIDIRSLVSSFRELANSTHRPTELWTFHHIEQQQRAIHAMGRRLELPPAYERILKLERAAIRYYPQLTADERLDFVATNADAKKRAVTLPYTEREIISMLDRASDILEVRSALGMPCEVPDYSETEARRFWRRYVDCPVKVTRAVA